jgi:hypothetical protein
LRLCTVWMWAVLVTFWRYMLPPSSGSKWVGWVIVCVCVTCICECSHSLTDPVHFNPEDGRSVYLRNVGSSPNIHTVQNPITESTSKMNHHESLKSPRAYLHICCCSAPKYVRHLRLLTFRT